METITYDEQQLIALYNTGSRANTISGLQEMRGYLEEDETELMELTEAVIEKLNGMTDEEFEALDLIPDFSEFDE